MKRLGLTIPLLGASLLFPAIAEAHDQPKKPPKRLSISFSAGIRPDMASLGSTIAQDGSIDTADSTVASTLYNTNKAFMSDRDNMTLAANSEATDSIFNVQSDFQIGGPMLGAEFGGDIRYELDDVVKFPLFVKAGFYFSDRISGGAQSRTLGDAATASGDIAAAFAINGLDAEDYVNGQMDTTWDASWYEIPISLGVKIPIKPHTFGYGYVGASYFSGGFDVGINVDERYANALTTHIDFDTDNGIPEINNYSPGAVNEVIRFRTSGIGLNYGLGVQVGIKRTWAVFVELNSSGYAGTEYSEPISSGSKQLLTALSSETLAQSDNEWFDQVAYPIIAGGATGRIGVRAYVF
ncbi:MAG: porin OmpL1 [Myxococcota bacterium]